MKIIHFSDLFAAKPQWYFKGQERSSTFLGLTFTLVLIGFFIWSCWYFSFDMVNKTNPTLAQTLLHGSTFENPMNLNSDDFPFAFGMLDQATKTFYTDPTIFTISTGVMDDDENIEYLNQSFCSPKDLYKSRVYKGLNGYASCFKNDNNLKILGMTSNIFIKIIPCQNISTFDCKSPDEISESLRTSSFNLFYKVSSFQFDHYKNFINEFWNVDSYSILPYASKIFNTYLLTVQIDTDSGWIAPDIETSTFLNIDKTEIDISEQGNDGNILSLKLFNSGTLHYYKRTYKKFDNFLPQIVSLMNIVVLIFGILAFPYARMKWYDQISREVFRIEQDSKKSHRKKSEFFQKTHIDLDTTINPVERSITVGDTSGVLSQPPKLKLDFSLITEDNGEERLYSHEPYQIKKPHRQAIGPKEDTMAINERIIDTYVTEIDLIKRKKELSNTNISFWEYITSFCRKNPKFELIKRTHNILKNRIDMINVIRKCMEVDMLKHLLLNRDQKILFEYLDRPAIYFMNTQIKTKSTNNANKIRLDNWISSNDTKSLKSAYQSIKNKETKSEIDNKLLAKIEEQAYENKK